MATEVADAPVLLAEAAPDAATESPAAADAKPAKAKKAAAPKKRANPTHPPYAEVIPVPFVSTCCSRCVWI
jgi:histone H1/5